MVVLEGVDDVVDEVAVRRGIPSEPVASVAVETLAVKHRRLVVFSARFVALLLLLRCLCLLLLLESGEMVAVVPLVIK